MPLYFRIPLPGPFVYARRVGAPSDFWTGFGTVLMTGLVWIMVALVAIVVYSALAVKWCWLKIK